MRARYCVIGCLCYRTEHVINYAYFISSEYVIVYILLLLLLLLLLLVYRFMRYES